MSREPIYDPQTLWQTQTTEDIAMSLQKVRTAAQRHSERNLRNKWIFNAALAGYILVSFAARGTGLGLLLVLRVILGAVWLLYLPRFREQPVSLSLSLTDVSPGLQFYRKELVMERDYFRSSSKWVTPVLYMTVIFVTSLSMGWMVAVPVCVVFAAFLVRFYFQRKQTLPGIEKEIRNLDSLG
jgi:hypothetical protein